MQMSLYRSYPRIAPNIYSKNGGNLAFFMQSKHLCVLIHILPKGEVGAVKLV